MTGIVCYRALCAEVDSEVLALANLLTRKGFSCGYCYCWVCGQQFLAEQHDERRSSGAARSAAQCMRLESRSASFCIQFHPHSLRDGGQILSPHKAPHPPSLFPLPLFHIMILRPLGLQPSPTPHFYRARIKEPQTVQSGIP